MNTKSLVQSHIKGMIRVYEVIKISIKHRLMAIYSQTCSLFYSTRYLVKEYNGCDISWDFEAGERQERLFLDEQLKKNGKISKKEIGL